MILELLVAVALSQAQASAASPQVFTEALVQSVTAEWTALKPASEQTFKPPRVVFLTLPLGHPGGGSGYDQRVGLIIDLADIERVRAAFGADGDELAGLIIAHEYGHYLQDVLGITATTEPGPEREQQADCYSGWWWGRQLARQGAALPSLNLDRRFPELLRLMSMSRSASFLAESDEVRHGDSTARVAAIRLGLSSIRPDVCGL